MTKEERLHWLRQIEKDIWVCSLDSTFEDDAKSCAIHSAIEELEQEPILDKLEVEIGDAYKDLDDYDPDSLGTLVCRINKIIDKYKAESEGKE